MAKAWDVKGFEQVIKRANRALKKELTYARAIGRDPESMRRLAEVTAKSAGALWRTLGASGGNDIKQQWRGRTYVLTGTLRQQSTTPGALLSHVGKNRITFRPQVKYARFVRPVFSWSIGSDQELARVLVDRLREIWAAR